MTECRYCGSKNLIKRGARKTQSRGKIQRFYCKDCKRRFVIKDGFFRMRNDPRKITASIDLYYRGMSLRKAQEHLGVFYEHNASHQTILNWIRKYARMIGKFVDGLELKNSSQLTFDEIEFKTKGKQSYFFDVMDMETRYIVGSNYFYKRGRKELKQVLDGTYKRLSQEPTDVYTDGLQVYPYVIRKSLWKTRVGTSLTQHVTASNSGAFNWKIERLHENIRERTKTMRQFKSLHSARAIMKGWEIWYNFCRKHQGINAYPYELATDLKLGQNKWLDLIELSI
jgi:transposase-like protein